MKKTYLYLSIIPFLLMLVLISAYTMKDKPSASVNNEKHCQMATSEVKPVEVAQVGENIHSIFEDSKGNLWFGTSDEGVAKYNPTAANNKLTYLNMDDGLCGKSVANIAEDKEGKLWFGTHSDMCIYDPNVSKKNSNGGFISFEKDADGTPMLGYGWKSVKMDPKKEIWVNTHHGIYQFRNGSFSEFKVPTQTEETIGFCSTPGKVSMALIDSKNNIWFRTDGDGVYMYNPAQDKGGEKTFTHYTKADGLSSNYVVNISEDKTGNIWFSCIKSTMDHTRGSGGLNKLDVSMVNSKKGVITRFEHIDGLHQNNINTIYADRNGRIWIGATGVGLYCFDPSINGTDHDKFSLFKEPKEMDITNTFQIDGLQSILEDSRGVLWLGYSGGLFRLEGDKIVNVTKNGPWI